MGYSAYDHATHATYSSTVSSRGLAGTAFAYNADVEAGRTEAKVHDLLNPRGVTRESRDSDAHPNSVPIIVAFDVTGSMKTIPKTFQQKLPSLMGLLALRGYVTDPQVMFMAVGDAVSDKGPLQVGQFESSVEMDDDLERIWLEGHGGGQNMESYELAHYFAARHTATDAWERRQRKGYLFTMGDECFYPSVEPSRVRHVMGDTLPERIQTGAIVQECQQRWHVFHFHVQQGSYRNDPSIIGAWRTILGEEHVILLENADAVAEMIGLVVGLTEGTVTVDRAVHDLRQLGYDEAGARALVDALGHVAARGIRLRDEAAV